MRKVSIVALLLAVLLIAAALPGYAGNIPGRLLTSMGFTRSNVYSTCSISGSNSSGIGNSTTDWEGIFYFGNLPAGIYSQGFAEKYANEPLYRKGISVPGTGDALWTVLSYQPTTFCPGNEWFAPWKTEVAQSFRATGDNILSVGLRSASDQHDIQVVILDGEGPNAPQIGPSRTFGSQSTDGLAAYWSAGDVPTVPGRIYTAKFTRYGGGQFSPWYQTVKWYSRNDNPDGRTWIDGIETTQPLEMTLTQDDAGMINTMGCARHYGDQYQWIANDFGQTFRAKGTSVLMVTWLTNVNQIWKITVHNGVGGTQIGPAKYARSQAWDHRSVATFAPGEVPTTAGQTYYVKIAPSPVVAGTTYTIYKLDSAPYSGGQAYRDGSAQSFDWAMSIYEEKFSGSIDQPRVVMNSFRVDTITPTSAVVRWSTDRLSDTTVDFGQTTPYTDHASNATLTTSHAVTLTGLKSNIAYHVRAISKATGCKEGITKDLVFVTAADSPNFLVDSGFESGAFGSWTKYGQGDIRLIGNGWYSASGPHSGTWALGGAGNNYNAKGGAYQRVPAVSGWKYRLSAWYWTYSEGGNYFTKAYQTVARIGIDPTGGTDPNSTSIVWSPISNSPSTYSQAQVTATASSSYITVFLNGGVDNPITWNVFTFDDVVLTTTTAPTSTTLANALKTLPDESYITFGGAVCTATSAQVGAYYVEMPDRSSALRVDTTDTINIGDMVTLTGILRTRTNGERYLVNAFVASKTPTTPIKPLNARCKEIGGADLGTYCKGIPGTVGPYNVGMLMKFTGKVTLVATGLIYVNDGSMSGNGVRIATGILTTVPTVGQTISVTGIVQPQGTAPNAVIRFRPRSQADVRVF